MPVSMLVDSHCHLDLLDLKNRSGGLPGVIDDARANGVGAFLCVGVDLEHVDRVLDTARSLPNVFASVGRHPLGTEGREPDVDTLVELATDPLMIAVGESGLDYYYASDQPELQRQRFSVHLEAARRARKPLIVHSRDAKEDTLAMIREEGDPQFGGVLHCFTGDLDMALRAIELNYYISISGIVTFRNAEALREVVRGVPLERLLVETDSPWLAPVPHRGKKNEPRHVREVAACVADLKGVSLEALADATTANFCELFRVDPKQLREAAGDVSLN